MSTGLNTPTGHTVSVVAKRAKIVPAFTVTELAGDRKRTRKRYNKEKRTFEDHEETIKGGYHLVFPRGHDIVVDTMDEVRRLVGDPEQVEMIDESNDEVVAVAHVKVGRKGTE